MRKIKSKDDFALSTFADNLDDYLKRYDTVEKINERLMVVRKAIRDNPRRNSESLPKSQIQEDNAELLSRLIDERDFLLYLRSKFRQELRVERKREINAKAYSKRRDSYKAFLERQTEAKQKKGNQSPNPI